MFLKASYIPAFNKQEHEQAMRAFLLVLRDIFVILVQQTKHQYPTNPQTKNINYGLRDERA